MYLANEMGWPMFWFHLFMNSTSSKWTRCLWKTKGDLSYFFIIGTLFILTLLYFLIRRLVFVKWSQDSQSLNYNVPIFKEKLWQNVFWYCFRFIFNSSIFLAFFDFVDDGCDTYKWFFVQIGQFGENSIYKYERLIR
jgi:hypothetical protein